MSDQQKGAPHLTEANFETVLAEAGEKPVMVDFFATWCGPCQMAAPVIDELAQEYQGQAVIAKVDVDQEAGLAQRFAVRSIPTVVLFVKGEEVKRVTGFAGKQGYLDLLSEAKN